MPVRQRNIRRRKKKSRTVADLNFEELCDLTCGWTPRPQWKTEEEFLGAYEEIREELLASEAAGGHRIPFAEKLWQKKRGSQQ
jgi:hypothetical protein